MKQLILTLMLMMVSTSTTFALHLKDVLYTNGKNNTHFAYWDELDENEYYTGETSKNFIIYLNDSVIRVDRKSVDGLIKNDFDLFYHDQPIGQIKQLRRETPEYIDIYNKAKVDMEAIRENCKNGIMYTLAREYYDHWDNNKYDIESGSFTFKLPNIYFKVIDGTTLPHQYGYIESFATMIAGADLDQKFLKGTKSIGRAKFTETINKIDVPIANKNVAMEIEEIQPQHGSKSERRHDYEFFYTFHLVDFLEKDTRLKKEEMKPYFEVTDVVLVHIPSQKVVWTAMTGDHSNE